LELLRKQEDGSVTYIALGPLTNLALALQADEKLVKQKVGMVSIMGGNLDVPGNTSPVAEFNVWAVGYKYLYLSDRIDKDPLSGRLCRTRGVQPCGYTTHLPPAIGYNNRPLTSLVIISFSCRRYITPRTFLPLVRIDFEFTSLAKIHDLIPKTYEESDAIIRQRWYGVARSYCCLVCYGKQNRKCSSSRLGN
jgi:hypothetical protein